MEDMDFILSSQVGLLSIVVLLLYIGEIISIRTKAWVPSVFVTACLFLGAYWTFLPADAISKAGIPGGTAVMLMAILVTNMGTLLSVRELMAQWRIIVVALGGIAGIVTLLLTVGQHFLDWNTVVVATPPLVGGLVSSILMSEGAAKLGYTELSVMAILIYVVQGFAGYPLTSIMLKKEGLRLLHLYRAGELGPVYHENEKTEAEEDKKDTSKSARIFTAKHSQYDTSYSKFFRLALLAMIAFATSKLFAMVGVTVNGFVLCLLFGIIGKSIGLVETNILNNAGGFGFAIMALMLFIFDTLKKATPEMVTQLMAPLLIIIVVGVAGMYVFSAIIGRLVGLTKEMAFAASLTALYGFPADYVITMEVIESLAETAGERRILVEKMLPSMLVAGFITVTIVSVILAGIMVNWIR